MVCFMDVEDSVLTCPKFNLSSVKCMEHIFDGCTMLQVSYKYFF